MNDLSFRESSLGAYLRDRRAKLDPAAFGFPTARRRTPGLRREEVAQRANISPAWYTWLEQGRGGAPSAEVLDRIAAALMLTEVEREHLFLVGLGRPPERHAPGPEAVTPRLQRILDALEPNGALIRNASWDVVAWNRAASVLLTDFAAMPPRERNVLRQMFLDPRMKAAYDNWPEVARFVTGVFRAEVTRAGALDLVRDFVAELSRESDDFATFWADQEVRVAHGGVKQLRHPVMGAVDIEFSNFAVDGRPDLAMVVYCPTDPAIIAQIRAGMDRIAPFA